MDELEKKSTSAAATTASKQENTINQMYDASLAAQKASLENSYNQSLSGLEQQKGEIAGNYQTSANDLAAQYERNRANFNASALRNGLNSGAYSQASLASASQYQRDYGALRTAENKAQNEATTSINNLKANYQNQILQAQADNDYKRAAALLDEYNNQLSRSQSQAQVLAQSGDFSGYYNYYLNQGYSADEAQQLVNRQQEYWNVTNYEAAYKMGLIDQATYNRYKNAGGGGGYYGTTAKTPENNTTVPENTQTLDGIHPLTADEYAAADAVIAGSGDVQSKRTAAADAYTNGQLSKQQYNYLRNKLDPEV